MPGRVRGGRAPTGGKPACGNPPTTPGKDTFPKSGSMIFRFGKSGRGGRGPGKGIIPGNVLEI